MHAKHDLANVLPISYKEIREGSNSKVIAVLNKSKPMNSP
jgi:hypothetical protein